MFFFFGFLMDDDSFSAAFSAALATVAGSGGVMTCACGLEGVVSDAAVWASYNVQEFEKAMVEVKRKIEATNDEEGEGEGTAVDSGEIVQCRGCGRSHEVRNFCFRRRNVLLIGSKNIFLT